MGLKSKLQADKIKSEETPPYQTSQMTNQADLSELMIRLKATEGYLSTFLKENMNKEIAITSELEKIKEMSQQIQEQMKLTSQESISNLQNVNEAYTKHIDKNMHTLANMIQNLNQELEKNRTLIERELQDIKENNQKGLNELNVTSQNYLKQQKTGLVINGWLDVFKYGLPTAVIVVGLQYLLNLFI